MKLSHVEENKRLSMSCGNGNVIFLSGLVGNPEKTDFDSQVLDLFKEIERVLEVSGSGIDNMLHVRIYLRDVGNFNRFNELYEKWLENVHRPARTCVGVELANEKWLAEAEVVAAVRD